MIEAVETVAVGVVPDDAADGAVVRIPGDVVAIQRKLQKEIHLDRLIWHTGYVIERTAEKPHSSAIVLTLRNDLNEVKLVPERLLEFFRSHDVSTSASYRGRLAVEELVVNVIRYGYDDANVHTIEIEVRIEDEMIVVRVEDDGRSFDPRGVPRPDLTAAVETRSAGGWGIHLVRSMSSELLYERSGNHNVVRVLIPLTARKG